MNRIAQRMAQSALVLLSAPLVCCLLAGTVNAWDGEIIQHGEMRQVLGLGRDEGRVALGDLTRQPHCYGVGALAELAGEVTIVDGQIIATCVDDRGQPVTLPPGAELERQQATMLVAAHVPRWTEHRLVSDVPADRVEPFLRETARKLGLDTAKPFPFFLEGELVDLQMHIINGACPMRAQRLGLTIPKARQPYRNSLAETTGRVVGVYAANAEHRLTHHGTQTHMHVLLKDRDDRPYTGHIERVGLRAGTRLRLPLR